MSAIGLGAVALAWTAHLWTPAEASLGNPATLANIAPDPFGALTPFNVSRAAVDPSELLMPRENPPAVAPDAAQPPGPSVPLPPARAKAPATETAAPDSVPLPPRKPDSLRLAAPQPPQQRPAAATRVARNTAVPATGQPKEDNRGFFERLFGAAQPAAPEQQKQQPRTMLAYARPDIGGLTAPPPKNNGFSGSLDRYTAVYDISAKTVTLPNGEKLEAHSGLGPMMDDPRHVHVKMNGPTPPNVYNLEMRKKLFHGVRAVRLIPERESDMFGRDGILAHSYLLGPNGDSNGCVSFKDYDRFLQAFLNGQVKRIVVVSRS